MFVEDIQRRVAYQYNYKHRACNWNLLKTTAVQNNFLKLTRCPHFFNVHVQTGNEMEISAHTVIICQLPAYI